MLPHLFMADVERWVEAEVVNRQAQSRELVQGVLDFLENQLGTGNEDIANVIHASFLEHLPRPGEPGSELRSMVGPLMAERLQQIG